MSQLGDALQSFSLASWSSPGADAAYDFIVKLLRRSASRDRTAMPDEDLAALHPAIGETIDEAISVHGHLIRFATVDLAADSGAIRRQLLKLSLQLKNETSADGPSHA